MEPSYIRGYLLKYINRNFEMSNIIKWRESVSLLITCGWLIFSDKIHKTTCVSLFLYKEWEFFKIKSFSLDGSLFIDIMIRLTRMTVVSLRC